MEIIIGRDQQTRQLCIIKDGNSRLYGQANSVPMDVSRHHISLVPAGSGKWKIKNLNEKNVTFVNGWFLNIPPNDKFDLVIMRDTLLCYNKELHIKALQCIADTLEGPNALLCIGPNERPLGIEERLVAENPEVGIYRLKN